MNNEESKLLLSGIPLFSQVIRISSESQTLKAKWGRGTILFDFYCVEVVTLSVT
jgi:hypothetical protein